MLEDSPALNVSHTDKAHCDAGGGLSVMVKDSAFDGTSSNQGQVDIVERFSRVHIDRRGAGGIVFLPGALPVALTSISISRRKEAITSSRNLLELILAVRGGSNGQRLAL